MASTVQKLSEKGIAKPPAFVPANTHYETIMGSIAYGVSTDSSDFDTVGWCIPPKEVVFPHLGGEIAGFGRQKKRFNCYQEHHLEHGDRTYDLNIYNVVDYFALCMENNPNMLDSLFTPSDCVLHATRLGQMVRERRHIFLHKGAWHKFKGYAYSQLNAMDGKKREPGSKRDELIKKYGYDVKFAYHTVRLLDECEQILSTGDIDLRRNREHLKAIRRGDVQQEEIRAWFTSKEKYLEKLYESSTLPWRPREAEIKQLLLDVLEEHYGNLSEAVARPGRFADAIARIKDIIDKVAA